MESIYVVIMSWGSGDNRDSRIIYVGTDYDKANYAVCSFTFPDEYNNYGFLCTWVNGIEVATKLVRE